MDAILKITGLRQRGKESREEDDSDLDTDVWVTLASPQRKSVLASNPSASLGLSVWTSSVSTISLFACSQVYVSFQSFPKTL